MSKSKKKVVVTTQKSTPAKGGSNRKGSGNRRGSSRQQPTAEMVFDKQNYIWMGAGIVLIVLGLLLMSGGGMDDPNSWDANKIYGFRRTVLSPILLVAGLVVEIYAIFKK
ncbi:MAG: DUF3098 domain-containing protein [Bacteroidetes bacterium]|nr:DUF3098 domain-containing protein [Bacteroidota bacterium]